MRRNQQRPNILNLIVWENVLILMMIIEDEYIFFSDQSGLRGNCEDRTEKRVSVIHCGLGGGRLCNDGHRTGRWRRETRWRKVGRRWWLWTEDRWWSWSEFGLNKRRRLWIHWQIVYKDVSRQSMRESVCVCARVWLCVKHTMSHFYPNQKQIEHRTETFLTSKKSRKW